MANFHKILLGLIGAYSLLLAVNMISILTGLHNQPFAPLIVITGVIALSASIFLVVVVRRMLHSLNGTTLQEITKGEKHLQTYHIATYLADPSSPVPVSG